MANSGIQSPEQYFAAYHRSAVSAGCDPDTTTALFPMITSDNLAHEVEAGKFLYARKGSGDFTNPDVVKDHNAQVYEAQKLVRARGYDPTPAHINAKYSPTVTAEMWDRQSGHNVTGKRDRIAARAKGDTDTMKGIAAVTADYKRPHSRDSR